MHSYWLGSDHAHDVNLQNIQRTTTHALIYFIRPSSDAEKLLIASFGYTFVREGLTAQEDVSGKHQLASAGNIRTTTLSRSSFWNEEVLGRATARNRATFAQPPSINLA
ncbi:hypothetical protein PTI98_004148 [Pleurotus ostreatus]|nr:hypothetical protein PTI98_004148 [Pleurotus ostreatus]